MADPFLGEVKITALPFAPQGWAKCDGQSLPVQQNAALFALLGTAFGGNNVNFNLPDMRGRTPLCFGAYGDNTGNYTYNVGGNGGSENVTLQLSQMPVHTHSVMAIKETGTKANGVGRLFASSPSATLNVYGVPTSSAEFVGLHPSTVTNGSTAPGHNNMQPYLTLNFCIAITGIFPPRN